LPPLLLNNCHGSPPLLLFLHVSSSEVTTHGCWMAGGSVGFSSLVRGA
jgi:hypothetical protein